VTNLTKQRRGEMLQAAFQVLAEHPEGLAAKDVLAAAEDRMELTEYELSKFETTGQPRFKKLVPFQTVNAVKAG
jgi:restriction system protein